MYLLQFIFLGLFILSFLFLSSKYLTSILNKVNKITNENESNEVLLILNYVFLCSYLSLKYYNYFGGLNYLILFSVVFIPSGLFFYKKYIYPFYDSSKFDFICTKDKSYILNILKVNHPKAYIYSFVGLSTIISLIIESDIVLKVATILICLVVLTISNVILGSKYLIYDSVIENVVSDNFEKIKDNIKYKNNFIDFFYCMKTFYTDYNSLNFLINYYEKKGKNSFIKKNLIHILDNLEFIDDYNKKTINSYMLNLKNSEITIHNIDDIYKIINYFFDIMTLDKIKNKVIFLETQKEGLSEFSLFFMAKIEFLNNNYFLAEKYLKKITQPNQYSINLEQELSIIKLNSDSKKISFSLDRSDYYINENDYKRNSEKDKLFLKKYKMDLLMLFDNSCAKTKTMEEIELDHFFIPKNQGGSFILKDKNGRLIINAIPLNKKINSSKKDKKINEIFNNEELVYIFSKLEELNNKINQKP
jgi:hypothetical protein